MNLWRLTLIHLAEWVEAGGSVVEKAFGSLKGSYNELFGAPTVQYHLGMDVQGLD